MADTDETPTQNREESIKTEETLEDLQARHRKEARELTNRITALKKTATKGDKKKKKEIAAEIALMESQLEEKHKKELKEFEERFQNGQVESASKMDDPQVEQVTQATTGLSLNETTPAESHTHVKKPNRQQQRKQKKVAKFDEERRQAAEEAANMDNMKEIELKAIVKLIQPMNRCIEYIPADGHCLYRAIANQYATTAKDKQYTFEQLRHITAEYLRSHPDDFLPFMTNDMGDMLTTEEFEKYCYDIENTPVWGGNIEIRALSLALQRPIHVVQMGSPVLKMGEDFEGKAEPLVLSYHKYYYGLGAHYNSLKKVLDSTADVVSSA